MVIAVHRCGLEPGNPVTCIDTLDEPKIGEDLEGAVHRRDPDGPARLAQPVEDLLGAQAAVLATEQLDDGGPGAAAPIAGSFERFECVGRPGHVRSVSSDS